MIPSKKIIIVLLFLFALNMVPAQIMSVTEVDRGKNREITLSQKQIIDINSSLEIKLSKSHILEAIKGQLPEYRPQLEMQDNIDAISQLLTNQEAILNSLESGIERVESQQEFFELMEVFLMAVQSNSYLSERYEALSEDYFSLPNSESVNMEDYIFSRFNEDGVKLKTMLNEIDTPEYSISLVAFKKDKQGGDRVHVENFDTYSEREYVTIKRWVTSLSESQQAELEVLAEKAKENNIKARSIFEDLKANLKTYLPDVTCLATQKEAILELINNPEFTAQISEAVKNDTSEFITELNTVINSVKNSNLNIASWDIATPFTIKDEVLQILDSAKNLPLDFNSFQSVIAGINALQPEIQNISAGALECFMQLKNYAENIQKTVTLLKLQQSNYTLNTEIGDEVKSFSLDNLPENGFVNLKGTGKRANGDELVLEVLLRIPSEKKGIPETKITLEQRHFYMQLLGARSEVAVGMIMASPFSSDITAEDVDRKFFFAPTASLLIKFGSKKSYFYNEFIDLGVGLNLASPDFNTDGAPEFGTGIIVTGFKDIISVGINYNVTLDNFYWFFGINLPFNLPGLPVGTGVKN